MRLALVGVGLLVIGIAVEVPAAPVGDPAPRNVAEMYALLQARMGDGVDWSLLSIVDLGAPPVGDFTLTVDWATMTWEYAAGVQAPTGKVASCELVQAATLALGYLNDPAATAPCPYKEHGFRQARSTVACGAVGGCFLYASRISFADYSFYSIYCYSAPVGVLSTVTWPDGAVADPTGACQILRFGVNPAAYDLWYGYCGGTGLNGVVACSING